MRFSEAIKNYIDNKSLAKRESTLRGYEQSLKLLCLHLHNPLVTQIAPEHITQYFKDMLALGWNKNGLLVKSIAFRKFFEYMRQKQYPVLDWNLIPIVQREVKMPDVLTEEEFNLLVQSCDEKSRFGSDTHLIRNKAILYVLEATGCRCGELISIELKDVDLVNQKLLVRSEKSKSNFPFRELFWIGNDKAHKAIKDWIDVRQGFAKSPKLFVGALGKGRGEALETTAIRSLLRNMSKKLKLDRLIHPHMFRHKFGRDLNDSENGSANAYLIAGLMGHSDMNSTRIYTEMNNKSRAMAYAKYKKKSI